VSLNAEHIESGQAPESTLKKTKKKAARTGLRGAFNNAYKPLLLRLTDIPYVTPLSLFFFIVLLTVPLSIRYNIPLSNPLQVAYTTAITLFLIQYFEKELEVLKSQLTLSDTQFCQQKKTLTQFKKYQYYGWSLVAPVLFIIVNISSPTVKEFIATGSMPSGFLLVISIAIMSWVIVIQCAYMLINDLLQFRRLGLHHTKVNLLNPSLLHPFGNVAIRTLLLSLGAYTVIPITIYFNGVSLLKPALISLLVGLPFTITYFYLPISTIMKRIVVTKKNELSLIDKALSGEMASRGKIQLDMGERVTNLDLLTYRQYVESVSRWPIGNNGLKRLLIYFIIPLTTWGLMSIANTAAFDFIRNNILPFLRNLT